MSTSTRYEVLTDNCTLAAKGATIRAHDFAHRTLNFDALVEGGHLRQLQATTPKQSQAPADTTTSK